MAICVSLCPPEELKTYQDLKRFAMLNGEVGEARVCVWEVPLAVCLPAVMMTVVMKVLCVLQALSCVPMSWQLINIPAYLTGCPSVPNFLSLPGKSRLALPW